MIFPPAEKQLELIRAEIQRYGHSVVGCDKLLVLVSDNAPIRSQFSHIFAIAEKEGWKIEFRPDGTVQFAPLIPAESPKPGAAFQQEDAPPTRRTA